MENKAENKAEKSYLTPIIIIVVVILLIAGGVFYSKRVVKNDTSGSETSVTSGNESESISTVSENTSLNNQTTLVPNGGTQNLGGFTYTISELGIKFRVPGEISDLTYIISPSNPKVALFSSRALRAQGGMRCAASRAPLGAISFDQIDAKQEARAVEPQRFAQIDGEWVSYIHPQATCSESKEIQDLQVKQKAVLLEAFKGITELE